MLREAWLDKWKVFVTALKIRTLITIKSRGYGIDLSCVKEWAKDPDKYAVLELVSQGIDDDYIIESFNLTEKEFLNFVPSDQELREYKPVFQRKELSDEELEARYQKMIESEGL